MLDGRLSQNREHLARQQRERRSSIRRIDYMPSKDALAIFQTVQGKQRPGSQAGTNSAVLDAIVESWAELTGINNNEIERPKTLAESARKPRPMSLASMARWPELCHALKGALPRVRCRAKRHRDGEPCQALSEPGKKRCRFHGGRSTGPKTAEGKAKCAANLPRKGAIGV